jgi:hypothetical protein
MLEWLESKKRLRVLRLRNRIRNKVRGIKAALRCPLCDPEVWLENDRLRMKFDCPGHPLGVAIHARVRQFQLFYWRTRNRILLDKNARGLHKILVDWHRKRLWKISSPGWTKVEWIDLSTYEKYLPPND